MATNKRVSRTVAPKAPFSPSKKLNKKYNAGDSDKMPMRGPDPRSDKERFVTPDVKMFIDRAKKQGFLKKKV